ncbi:putative ATP-grasp-modified RiPP [Kribbella solani]|uniref:putative ATP-grasp-modified RiPP n=1 Tax=Kribbella solani TaxID=236067 RepID=UPI0029A4FEBA|nr:putative ATP-grasp-modified RiPP [Kribbella solani]MDX3001475.1 putative ATP-grasp-modified RiPP [Kribbella solani]
MFRFADRFPLASAVGVNGEPPRPWGLSRMEVFPAFEFVPELAVGLDPASQRGLYQGLDGVVSMAPGKHSRSKRGTERPTKTGNTSDGSRARSDTDHGQDTKLD